MKPAPFDYHAPRSIGEAVASLAEFAAADCRVIAGGQSLVPMMAFRLATPQHLVDINRIADLARLASEDGVLRIGALVRHAAFETGDTGGTVGRLLAAVAPSVAHPPLRNRGTFCGSLANADPAAEWCLVAVTLDARIVARNAGGIRILPAAGFFEGVLTTALRPDELVTECRLPLLADDTRFGFDEVSRRAGDFAMAAALAVCRLEDGRIAEPRLGLGGVEPRPRRLAEVEAMLAGAVPDRDLLRRAAERAAEIVDPMEDVELTARYRRQLTRAVVERALRRCFA
jgi:carbon-monoxide dehydrogenase medium subunit